MTHNDPGLAKSLSTDVAERDIAPSGEVMAFLYTDLATAHTLSVPYYDAESAPLLWDWVNDLIGRAQGIPSRVRGMDRP